MLIAIVSLSAASAVYCQETRQEETAERLCQLPESEPGIPTKIHDIEVSPDGNTLIFCASDNTVQTLALKMDPVRKIVFEGERAIRDIAISRNGTKIALAGGANTAIIDLATIRATKFKGQETVALSPEGNLFAVGTYRDDAHLFDLKTGEVKFNLNPFSGVGPVDTALYNPSSVGMSFSPDGSLLAVTTDFFDDELPSFENIQLWDVISGKLRFSIRGGACQFSPDSRILAYRSHSYTGDGRVVLLDLNSYLIVGALTGSYQRLRYAPNGKSIAVTNNNVVELWTVTPRGSRQTCKRVLRLAHTKNVTAFAFGPDSKTLITSDESGTIRRWKIF